MLANLPREQKRREQLIGSLAGGGKVALSTMALLVALLTGASLPATALVTQVQAIQPRIDATPGTARQAQIQKLRRALEEESQRAIYRWHDEQHPNPPTWLDKQLERLGKALSRAWNAIAEFFRKLWPRGFNLSSGGKDRGAWHLKNLRLWLILIGTATLATATVLFWLRSRRKNETLSIPVQVAPLPDLSEAVIATSRSEDEWFALANRLRQEGELRLAVRAAYLGLLAGLAQRQWLSIRRDRTNREYLEEFMRRWRRRPQAALDARTEVAEKLGGSLRQFDVVWYGSLEMTAEAVAKYQREQMELLSHV